MPTRSRDQDRRCTRLVLLVGVAACGLAWTAFERRITPTLTTPQTTAARLGVAVLGLAWLILPGLVYLLGFVLPATAFVLFPASIGAGALLWVYAARLRRHRSGADHRHGPGDDHPADDRSSRVALALVGLLVLVCLFWTASNYAQVLGDRLADEFVGNVDRLPGVVVSSERSLFLDGPGVDEVPLPGSEEEGALRYRYEGLRLLEHTGGHYFLVSDAARPGRRSPAARCTYVGGTGDGRLGYRVHSSRGCDLAHRQLGSIAVAASLVAGQRGPRRPSPALRRRCRLSRAVARGVDDGGWARD